MEAEDRALKQKMAQEKANATSNDPISRLRCKIMERNGVRSIKVFGRLFKIMDDDGNRGLSMEEFAKGVREQGVTLTEEEFKGLFEEFDKDKTGTILYDEFIQALRPPMSENRKKLIAQAFSVMDADGSGVITVADLKDRYSVKDHPKYLSGEMNPAQIKLAFLKNFDTPNDADGQITQEEFYNYYAGVSASIDTDSYFDLMMRNTWKF